MTEEEVWKLTPRKLQALLKVHHEIEKQKYGQKSNKTNNKVDGFIDNIPGW